MEIQRPECLEKQGWTEEDLHRWHEKHVGVLRQIPSARYKIIKRKVCNEIKEFPPQKLKKIENRTWVTKLKNNKTFVLRPFFHPDFSTDATLGVCSHLYFRSSH
jgi:hypothetical protein